MAKTVVNTLDKTARGPRGTMYEVSDRLLHPDEFIIKGENVKYTKDNIYDGGRFFNNFIAYYFTCCENGTIENEEVLKSVQLRKLAWELMPVVAEDVTLETVQANNDFLSKFSEEYYVEKTDTNGVTYKVLDYEKLNKEDPTGETYKNAIQEWEFNVRSGLVKDLAETWMWKEDKTDSFKEPTETFGQFPITSPVHIPSWMFACNSFNEDFMHLNDIEKVALAHALHYTKPMFPGYKECSGQVERWCRCSVEEAHNAFVSLYHKGLLLPGVLLAPENCHGLIRNMAWKANFILIRETLALYGRDIRI